MDDEERPVRYRFPSRNEPRRLTMEFRCQMCGWPWNMTTLVEPGTIDIHKSIICPNCGQSYTMDFHTD